MRPRASHLFVVMDYAVGTFFVLALFVLGVTFFVITGAPKRYEMQELGAAYTDFLLQIEGSARDLRADYCTRADTETAAAAKCNDVQVP